MINLAVGCTDAIGVIRKSLLIKHLHIMLEIHNIVLEINNIS